MTCRVGLLWDTPLVFSRLIEDCGASCETVTPHMLATPFWRGSFAALIVPTGFANPAYSKLLPALRASSDRIERFVERGGRILVFGAASPHQDTYDWLPIPVTYLHSYGPRAVRFTADSPYNTLLSGYDLDAVECDGTFPSHGGKTLAATPAGETVLIMKETGDGVILVTSVHEYPSREFLANFSCADRETLF
jgi:hypothetical protein